LLSERLCSERKSVYHRFLCFLQFDSRRRANECLPYYRIAQWPAAAYYRLPSEVWCARSDWTWSRHSAVSIERSA